MVKKIVEDALIESKEVFEDARKYEFVNCSFKGIDFSSALLVNHKFLDCKFLNCNMSMTVLDNSTFHNVKFIDSKLQGIDFSKCAKLLFSVSFERCLLNFAYFFKNDFKKVLFNECIIKEAQFIEVDLRGAVFRNCDLSSSLFDFTNMEHCDFTTARYYIIDPERNKIKKAKFSMPDVVGLLSKYDVEIY